MIEKGERKTAASYSAHDYRLVFLKDRSPHFKIDSQLIFVVLVFKFLAPFARAYLREHWILSISKNAWYVIILSRYPLRAKQRAFKKERRNEAGYGAVKKSTGRREVPTAQGPDWVIRMRTYRYFLLLFWVGQPYSTFSTSLSQRTSVFPAKKRASELSGNSKNELNRSKRSWMWNQFFLLEEYTGSDYQYVGKVGFHWAFWHSGFKSLKKLLQINRRGRCELFPNTVRIVAYLVRFFFPLE